MGRGWGLLLRQSKTARMVSGGHRSSCGTAGLPMQANRLACICMAGFAVQEVLSTVQQTKARGTQLVSTSRQPLTQQALAADVDGSVIRLQLTHKAKCQAH